MSFTDTLDNLTGRQLKRVQQLTGTTIDKSSGVDLSYAVGYVGTLHPEQIKNWGELEQTGFEDYLDSTTYRAVRIATGQEDEDTDPKGGPAS